MSGTIIGIANAFGASISPGAAQGSAPGPPPSQAPMNFYVTPYNSAGTSTPSGQYKLGLYSTGTYDFTVDWGDGNTDVITSYNQPEVTHDYGTVLPTDNFEITITPNVAFPLQAVNSWYFGNRNEGDGVKVRSIDQFGATVFYADQDIFYGCEALGTFASTISNVPTILNKVIGNGFFFNCDELAPAFYTAYWVGPFTGTAESFNEGKSVAGLPVGNSRGKFQLDFTPTNMFRAFKNQAIFNQNDAGLYWDVSSCNNFTECFSSCLRYNQPFPNWTFLTGTPVFAADMFKNAVDFNQNITGWNTSAFQDMGGMFARTLPVGSGGVTDSVFNQAIGVWNTDNVRDASAMFFNAVNFNQDLSNWFSTGSLQNIGPSSGGIVSMFSGATSFNGSVANWDLTNPLLTSVSYVFNGATSFDQPLNSWDVSGVSFFVGTFNGATAFNQNLALWDVSSGLFFSEMFKGATSFVGTSLTSWNVSSATDMQDMFNGATSFTNSLVFWNPSSVTNMSGMFNGATLANPNVSGWNISSLANASDMFTNSGLSSFNYQALLVAWAAQAPNIQSGVTLSSINQYANFGAPADAKAKLVNDYGWTITDLVNPNLPPPALTFTIDTTATEVGSTANNQYRLPLISSGTYDFYVQWGDGDAEQITSWNQAEATHTYAAAGTYTVKMFAVAATTTPIIDHISWASQDGTTLSAANDRLKVQDISGWASAVLYLNEYVFTNCENLNITTTSSPTFGSKVLRTSAFENCDNLSGDLSGWGTVGSPITGLAGTFYKNSTSNPNFNFVLQHNVGSLIQPFQNCAAFNNPLNNWDVSSVIGFTAAFSGASAFNQDISGWDTGNSSAFNAMFSNALAFNQNISSWNVASVTTFSQMFQGATLFNQPVGAWTTTSLTNLFSTFKNAAAFDQDLANWDVSGVTTAVDMLTGSNISAANWDALLIGWAAQGTGAGSLQANVTLSNINQLHGSVDSAATAAYNKLTSAPYNWTIVDLGGAPVGNLLLDTSYGSGAEAAYSVRKLRTAYTGPAIKVQDTVGGATQDIYFDANNNLDEAAIVSYGGSNDVFVETWYDQSVNGNDAEQPSSTLRPKIYDGTTGALVKKDGRVAIEFDGSNDYLDAGAGFNLSTLTMSTVQSAVENVGNTDAYVAISLQDTDNNIGVRQQIKRAAPTALRSRFNNTNIDLEVNTLYKKLLFTTLYNGTNGFSYFDGSNEQTATATLSSTISLPLIIGKTTASAAIYKGNLQEALLFNTSKSTSDRTSIESNIGDYFTQNTPLLDTYSGAAAAYSLRLLDSTYTGSAVQVQDTVGGATQDIGFNVFGELDTVALAAYGGSNDVFVATWYDQSGNSNDAAQPTSTARPKIYDGTTGVVTENGKPAVDNQGGTQELQLTSSLTGMETIIAVAKQDNGATNGYLIGSSGDNSLRSQGGWRAITGSPAPSSNDFYFNGSIYIDGVSLTSNLTTSNQVLIAANSATGGYNYALEFIGGTYPSRHWDGPIQELIIFSSEQSTSNRTGIEINANTFYDIYTEPVAPLLLNNYPGAAAAYSLRRINSSYQGSAVLVQTALNTKGPVYIGFDSNNDLDTTSLATYGGSEDVVVAGWLDQSGNGNDASQATSANRPKIYDGTTGVVLENGKPAVEFDGSNDYLNSNTTPISGYPFTIIDVSIPQGTNPKFVVSLALSTAGNQVFAHLYNSQDIENQIMARNTALSRDGASYVNGNQYLSFLDFASSTSQSIFQDGVLGAELSTTTPYFSPNRFTIGYSLDSTPSDPMQGLIQEIIVYNSDQSTNRTDIEENIGGYYDIPLPGLLDENPGAAAAYSLRRLSSTYTGSAIQVQRADNVGGTTDIGFDGYGDLDTTALTTAAAGNDMVVATWYDQSGSGNDATQGTSANRPKIYDATTGVVKENGKAMITADATEEAFDIPITSTDAYKIFSVMQSHAPHVFLGSENANDFFLIAVDGNNSSGSGAGFTLSSSRLDGNSYTIGTRNNVYDDFSMRRLFYADIDLNFTGTTLQNSYGGNSTYRMYNSQELIFYPASSTNSITSIEENIGGYYDIPLAGLLDENPGAAAAYSLRRLSSTYTGSAIQVQRADNVGGTTDIGFDSYGELDTTALTTAAQGNDMVVATWYDQSGNSNDATQGTSANRPKIYDGTTGVVLENGKPAVEFDGVSNELPTPTIFSDLGAGNAVSVFHISKCPDTTDGTVYNFSDSASSNFLSFGYNFTSGNYGSRRSVISPANNTFKGDSYDNTRSLFSQITTTTTNNDVYRNGVAATDTTVAGASRGSQSRNSIGTNGSYFFKGVAQEIITYASDQSANRLSIEDNVGDYYGIEIAGLLDQYSGAAAAYSLRKLSNSYTGFAVKVQDNVGGATQDIGFNADGELDTVALLAYAGSNDVFVETWYDQSGNGRDVTQGTSTARPKIYDGTTGVITRNGKASTLFNGSSSNIGRNNTDMQNPAPLSTFTVNDHTSTGVIQAIHAQLTSPILRYTTADKLELRLSSSSYFSTNVISGQVNTSLVITSSNTATMHVNSSEEFSGSVATYSNDNRFSIGSYVTGGAGYYFNGYMQEVVIYRTDQSANRAGIETNINFFYDIY